MKSMQERVHEYTRISQARDAEFRRVEESRQKLRAILKRDCCTNLEDWYRKKQEELRQIGQFL